MSIYIHNELYPHVRVHRKTTTLYHIIWLYEACVFIHNIHTEYSSMACVPGSHGQVDTETELHAESQDTREHKIADKPEKMKYKCIQIKWMGWSTKMQCKHEKFFWFLRFFFRIYYMSTFHYLLVQATSIQFVIALFGWRAKIKRYCYTKLCESLHTNVYILFATGAGAVAVVSLLHTNIYTTWK